MHGLSMNFESFSELLTDIVSSLRARTSSGPYLTSAALAKHASVTMAVLTSVPIIRSNDRRER